MLRYSTNWMGPVNYEWTKKNGDYWAGGRIDVYGSGYAGGDYPDEIALPIMHKEDYGRFSKWLDSFTSIDLWSLEELVYLFEKETKTTIHWFHTPHWKEQDDSLVL
jgi:hypothetical protein